MTGNEKYDNDPGRVGTELMRNARMQRNNIIAEHNARAESQIIMEERTNKVKQEINHENGWKIREEISG